MMLQFLKPETYLIVFLVQKKSELADYIMQITGS